MAVSDPSRVPETRIVGYRFAGVALDLRRGSLRIDGEEVAATPLLLQLLQILCESDGRLLARQELFDALWPGGQTVSDAALSQLIWRLRSLLGPYGGLVATLRRSGVRLEAPVSAEFDVQRGPRGLPPEPFAAEPPAAASGSVPVQDVAPPAASAAGGQRSAIEPAIAVPPRRRGRLVAAVLALAALMAGLAFWLLRDPMIFDGYALRASDLQASRGDTARIAAAAFAAEQAGDRERAIALMRSLHESDPTTPIPAAMLAWWRSHAAPEEAADWGRAARARLRADTSPYLRLFVDYVVTRSGNDSYRGALNAALELRPAAWRMQYARAHVLLAGRDFAGALRSLQQVPVRGPEPGLLADVLADRISLGDAGAAALARELPAIAGNPTLRTYLQGREAYSAGRLTEALAALDESARHAQQAGDYLRQIMASELAGIAAFELAGADTVSRLSATRRLCQDRGRFDCVATALGLQAVLEARRGEAGRASALLAEAWQVAPQPSVRPALLLVALENRLAPPGDVQAMAADIADDLAFAGVADLLRGWQAWAGGDRDGAVRALDAAQERGVAQTYSAEDAALLGARLGQPATPCRVDPPYPNSLRLSACLQLRELQKSQQKQQSVAL